MCIKLLHARPFDILTKNALIKFLEWEAISSTLQLEVSWSACQRLSRFAIVLLLAQVRLSPSDFISHFISLPVSHTHGQIHKHTHTQCTACAHSLTHANTRTWLRAAHECAEAHVFGQNVKQRRKIKRQKAATCGRWKLDATLPEVVGRLLCLVPFPPPGMELIDFTLLKIKIG